jgi:hypothetical protein
MLEGVGSPPLQGTGGTKHCHMHFNENKNFVLLFVLKRRIILLDQGEKEQQDYALCILHEECRNVKCR